MNERMSVAHAAGQLVDGIAVAHVANFDLGSVELIGKSAKSILSPRHEHAPPAVPSQRTRDRSAEAARGARDDGDALGYLQTRIVRFAEMRLPCLSAASALRM
jgi:hypothetical protein